MNVVDLFPIPDSQLLKSTLSDPIAHAKPGEEETKRLIKYLSQRTYELVNNCSRTMSCNLDG